MKILFIFIMLNTITWATKTQHEYIPVQEDNQALIDSHSSLQPHGPENDTNNILSKVPAHVRTAPRLVSVVPDKFRTGDQADIDRFNKKMRSKNKKSIFTPQPYGNRTNSYWLDPNFQFGPGSVNDFGGDPNAEQMLAPFIF